MGEQTNNGTWGTWDELLLASAVKRHGFKAWDSVSMEVQARTSLPPLLTTAQNCKQKYHDLKRRFTTGPEEDAEGEEEDQTEIENAATGRGVDKVDNIPWLEELRKLRVAELRQEVQRYDVSILSLQLKLKRLEEEREPSPGENGDSEVKPDLDNKSEGRRSETDKIDVRERQPEKLEPAKAGPGEESDRENGSVNESNSTGENGKAGVKTEPEPEKAETGSDEPDRGRSGSKAVAEDSYDESSDSIARDAMEPSREKKESGGGDESSELMRDTVAKESSEAQSSASLTRRKRWNGRRRRNVGGSGMSSGDEPPEEASLAAKSRPLIRVIEMIRAHPNSSLFERRLESQESDKYKKMVRLHVDLETIQARLRRGQYSSSIHVFYRDLLLLFTNAIIFFPKSSPESVTAIELQRLVLKVIHKRPLQEPSSEVALSPPLVSQPKIELERSDSLLAKHKSSAPIIVCRKRSSMNTKPSIAGFGPKGEQQGDEKKSILDLKTPVVKSSSGAVEEQNLTKLKTEEKPVTGARSSRRNVKNLGLHLKKKQSGSPGSKLESEKKRAEALALEKKRSAADFLKRIKRNSPADTLKNDEVGVGGEQKKRLGNGDKAEKGKERLVKQGVEKKQGKLESSPTKRSVGRPPKKVESTGLVSGKRGRENSKKEVTTTSKRPVKRSKR